MGEGNTTWQSSRRRKEHARKRWGSRSVALELDKAGAATRKPDPALIPTASQESSLSRFEFQLIAMSTLVLPVIHALHKPGVRLVIRERSLRSNREVFAMINLEGPALVGLDLLYRALQAAMPAHEEVTIYLNASAHTLERRVAARGRLEEGALDQRFHRLVVERHDLMYLAIEHPKAQVDTDDNAQRVAARRCEA